MENPNPIISGFHIAAMLSAGNGKLQTSLDLGLSKSVVEKSSSGVTFPGGQFISIEKLQHARRRHRDEDCFTIEGDSMFYLYRFDGKTAYRLYEPKKDWPPTLWINGSMMHTVSVSKPTDEAMEKARELGRRPGMVLETCFGLGYSAIALIQKCGAIGVSSHEISSDVLDIARENPWSGKALSDSRINVSNNDIKEAIHEAEDSSFDSVLHDPPNVKIDGELYSEKFYSELFRVLKRGGKLYHFVGGGKTPHEYKVNYTRGVMRRLSEAGFSSVKRSYRGVSAVK
ncbi:MAG: methyltransferase domain-containing protein [Candidatus Marsarchaeota archaeon]|nr:methyltransferase domain-containing protein [Candidatus Marsarchaeota archaeon]